MSGARCILLAEDNPRDVELTLAALAEHPLSYDVVIVRDGPEVLDYLHRRAAFEARPGGDPAVVVLDIKMPRMSGLEVLKRIRADARLHSLPVVMLTSSSERRDLVESYRLGANAYVVKPVAFDDFIGAVKSLGQFWTSLNEPPPESDDRRAHGAAAPR